MWDVLAFLGRVAAAIWWLAPLPISLVLAGMFFGYLAVLLVPRDRPWMRPTLRVRRPAPWAVGHDPDDAVQAVEVPDDISADVSAAPPRPAAEPLAEIIPIRPRRHAA